MDLRVLVFSEADAILGNSADESHAQAVRILEDLDGVTAIVLCSMKTRAQIEQTQQRLRMSHPFIAEGGCAIFVPEGYFPFTTPHMRLVAGYEAIDLARSYDATVGVLAQVAARQQIEIVGFGDMSVAEVARECRIPLLEARLAKLRDHSECFRLLTPSESARRRLARALEVAGLHYVAGEPFDQVSSVKGYCAAMKVLRRLYHRVDSQVIVGVDLAEEYGGQCGLASSVGMSRAAERSDIVGWARAISVFVATDSKAHLPSR